MRRYFAVVLFFVLCFAFFCVFSYEVRDDFYLEHRGFVKDIRVYPKSFLIYVDDVVVSCFGEPSGFHLGDEVLISGEASDVLGLENSGFARFLKGRGSSYIVNGGSVLVKDCARDSFSLRFSFLSWMGESLDRLYGESSFFPKALLLGEALDKELLESFRLSGTSHILALSGFHVGFIVLFFNLCFQFLGIRCRYVVVALILVFYAFVTGARASILRSVAFFFLFFGAFLRYRRFDVLSGAMAIACFMLALNPFVIYDLGFVLSFLCVCSIFMFCPMVDFLFFRVWNFRFRGALFYVYSLVSVTVCAQILALPYMIFSFGRVAVLSIFANVLVLPLVSLLMGVVVLSLLFGGFLPFARLLADLGVIIIDVIVGINVFVSELSFANFEVSLDAFWAFGLSFLLVGCFLFYEFWRVKENRYEL